MLGWEHCSLETNIIGFIRYAYAANCSENLKHGILSFFF
jgi:hypothetical protein